MPRPHPFDDAPGSVRSPSAGTGRPAGFRPSCRKSAEHRRRPSTCPPRYSIDASTSRSISRWKPCAVAIGPQPAPRAWSADALPAHHVGRHRPRRAAKSDQSDVSWGRSWRNRATVSQTRANLGRVAPRVQAREIRLGADRLEPRPLALDESHFLAKRIGHDQDVGKQDRRVETEAPDRLQRHLGRQLGRVAQIEEALRPSRAPPGTPAGSGRPAASARSAAATARRRANTSSRRGRVRTGAEAIASNSQFKI